MTHVPKRTAMGVLLSIASLLMLAQPGSTQTLDAATGAGGGTGWESLNAGPEDNCPVPPFLEVQGDDFTLYHTGNYTAVDALGQEIASYEGPTVVNIKVGQHTISPEGTYECLEQPPAGEVAVPAVIPIVQATVHGETRDANNQVTGSVDCVAANFGPSLNVEGVQVEGYERRGGEAVTFTFTHRSCTIDGNIPPLINPFGSVTVQDVRHVIEGTLTPCTVIPPIGFPENPACDIALSPYGDNTSGMLVTTYQVGGSSELP